MKRLVLLITLIFFLATGLFAQQKYALVIGNGAYTGISRLNNPVNDANDVSAALQSLGFTVDKVLDANLDQMETSIMQLKNRLSVSKNSYGFFFYAGHGVYATSAGSNAAGAGTSMVRNCVLRSGVATSRSLGAVASASGWCAMLNNKWT